MEKKNFSNVIYKIGVSILFFFFWQAVIDIHLIFFFYQSYLKFPYSPL